MKTTNRKHSGFTLIELLVVIAIIATLAGVGVPALMAKKKDGDRAQAVMNAKQIGLALFSFGEDYGRYPDTDTKDELPTDAIVATGTSTSNAFFSQLIAGNYIDQEKPFYAKATFTSNPDNNMSSSAEILKKGECGFAYIMRQGDSGNRGLSGSYNSAIPVAVAAPQDGSSTAVFDLDVYNRKAVILKIDQSASVLSLDDDGKAVVQNNPKKTLLDTGSGTVWGSSTQPVFVPPAY